MKTNVVHPSYDIESPQIHERMRSQTSFLKTKTPFSPLLSSQKTDRIQIDEETPEETPEETSERSKFFKNIIDEIDFSYTKKASQTMFDYLSSKFNEKDIFRISKEMFIVSVLKETPNLKGEIHILNFYAYSRKYEIIKILLKLYEKHQIPLILFKDYKKSDVLEISIELKDFNLAQTLVNT